MDMEGAGSFYEIRIKEHLDDGWETWFDGMAISHLESGATLISGSVKDQAALHGLLERIRMLNITLISVQLLPAPPDHRKIRPWWE